MSRERTLGFGFAAIVVVALAAIVATATGGRGNDSPPAAECMRAAASGVVVEGEFAAVVTDVTRMPAGVKDPRGPRLLQLECADLTGDGVEEMVVRVGQGRPSAISPWAIFRSAAGQWELAIARDTVSAELRIADGSVIEAQPVYREGGNACCPSDERTGVVAWDGDAFAFTPDEGTDTGERTVTSRDATVTRVGPFLPRSGDAGAQVAFGTPSQTVELGLSCLREWPDLGLAIGFASLGVAAPCDGAVQTVSIGGLTGEQAGWRTAEGLALGDGLDELRALYPEARQVGPGVSFLLPRRGTVYLLREAALFGTRVPVLSARVDGERVIGLEFYVGLAGE